MSYKEKHQISSDIFMFAALFLICAILFIFFFKNSSFALSGKTKDANKIISSGERLRKNDNVTIKLYYVTEAYAESKNRIKGITNTTFHYIAWLEDDSLISISSQDSETIYKLNNFARQIKEYSNGKSLSPPDPIVITGHIMDLDSEVRQFYNEAITIGSYSINPNTMHYERDETKFSYIYNLEINTSYSKTFMFIGLIVSGFFTLAFGLLTVLCYINYKKISDEIVTKPVDTKIDNDPIFNNSFYDTYMKKDASSDNSDDKADENNETDDSLYQEKESGKSSFKLKDL
ncbi:MAG: hypothetical protein IJ141_10385 [Lachnospiraceae bacterium]|nr:hypothetical protein [Lachnospiraceae bacterium]